MVMVLGVILLFGYLEYGDSLPIDDTPEYPDIPEDPAPPEDPNYPDPTPGQYSGEPVTVSVVYFWDYDETSGKQPPSTWKIMVESELNNIDEVYDQCPSLNHYYHREFISVRDFYNKYMPEEIYFDCTFYGPIFLSDALLDRPESDYYRFKYAWQLWYKEDPETAYDAYTGYDISLIIVDGIDYHSFAIRDYGTAFLGDFMVDSRYNEGDLLSSSSVRLRQLYLLAHEILHLYDAPDHYPGKRHDNYDPDRADEVLCVMGMHLEGEMLTSETVICDYCQNNLYRSVDFVHYPKKVRATDGFWSSGDHHFN